MTDITCCLGEGCPLKDKCHRYTAPKDPYWQSFFMIPPYKQGEPCGAFWDNSEYKTKEKNNERKQN